MRRGGTIFATLLFGALTAIRLSAAVIVPAPPQVDATAHMLVDFSSARVLAGNNEDRAYPPASLAKIMTVYVVASEMAQRKFTMQDTLVVSEKAWRMPGSRMYIEVGKRVSVEELLRGVIIQSGNDASVALAEFTSGSEEVFADLMNRYAQGLGMHESRFGNSSGLPHPDHAVSARDLVLLSSQLIRNFPDIYRLHAEKSYSYNGIRQHNRNRLLWQDDSVDGIKTGHTDEAGYCLVASAQRGDMRLISVVMDSDSEQGRIRATRALLDYGFRFFETAVLHKNGASLHTIDIWKGEDQSLVLGLEQDLVVTFPRGARDELEVVISADETISAPVHRGQTLGRIVIRHQDRTLADRPLVALQDIAEGGLWRRLSDHVRLWFH